MLYWKTTNRRVALLKFLELQTIHTENLEVSGGTTYNIGRMGRENESSECFYLQLLRMAGIFSVTSDCGQRYESNCLRSESFDRNCQAFSHDLLSRTLPSHVLLVSRGLSFDHRFLVNVDARTRKTSLTTVNRND